MIRILIADGDERRLAVLAWLLDEDARFDLIASVGWGEAALDRNEPVDAAVLDIALPGLDVFRTVRALRQRDPQPTVVVAGLNVPYLRAAALDAGAHAYVDRSASGIQLVDVVADLHTGRARGSR